MTVVTSFEQAYEEWIDRPHRDYRRSIGTPVNLDAAAFEEFVQRLRAYRAAYPSMALWLTMDYSTLSAMQSEGDINVFGAPVRSKRDLVARIHPDYLLPYLRWRRSAYALMSLYPEKVRQPLKHTFRISLPFKTHSGQYWWFCMNSAIVQQDAQGRIATTVETLYRESTWSRHNLRPLEASLFSHEPQEEGLNAELAGQLSLLLMELFTDAELDLLALYASGTRTDSVLAAMKWSRHTLHEYNTHLLRKARELFVYEFKNARQFAEYCQERHILKFKPHSPK
ncbi:MAG: hypothetical protein RMJ33_09110 [Saprospiraceae bacterium]|nr:hypothetical protein [Saprospiraceae bacterium]MDW8229983.1 hypothetical protein [Saprospiraceae bacterium]